MQNRWEPRPRTHLWHALIALLNTSLLAEMHQMIQDHPLAHSTTRCGSLLLIALSLGACASESGAPAAASDVGLLSDVRLVPAEPDSDLAILGGGGILLILDNLWWDRPEQSLRLWLGVGLGVAAIIIGLGHVWVHFSSPE